MGSRTPDLLIANEMLYQLSYDPIQNGSAEVVEFLGRDLILLCPIPQCQNQKGVVLQDIPS